MSRRPLRHRLTFRFSVAFCVGAGVLFAGVEAWTLSVHREQLTRLVETQATELAEVVRRSTRDAMMRNDPGQVRSILETVASQQPIERIPGERQSDQYEADQVAAVQVDPHQIHRRDQPQAID